MAFVDFNSQLIRNAWLMKGLVQANSKSFWAPLTGASKDNIVMMAMEPNAKEGLSVVFDWSGNLAGRPIEGKDTAAGKGEQKKKFSDNLKVRRYRYPVDNGDSFDGVEIGNLAITQHQDSVTKLGDLWIRGKDQSIFDSAQGHLGQGPTHVFDLGTTFGYDELIAIETAAKTSVGFDIGGTRRPLSPSSMAAGQPMWIFIIDSTMAQKLKTDEKYQSLVAQADFRGTENRIIKGVIGKIGNLIIIEAPLFFGDTDNASIITPAAQIAAAGNFNIKNTAAEISGLRQRDAANLWTGQPGFVSTGQLFSRGLLMGAGAMMLGFGKHPEYHFQESTDFGITSESALEVWYETEKTKLTIETEDYVQAKVANIDWGVIAVDVEVQAA